MTAHDRAERNKGAVTPDETLLVVDAMTGQEAATLTARFNSDIGITGAILTKIMVTLAVVLR